MALNRVPGCCCGAPVCTATVCVTGCPTGAGLVGAIVAVNQTDGTFVNSSATTSSGGTACANTVLAPPFGVGPGNYIVSVSASGFEPWTATVALTCGGTFNVALQPVTAPPSLSFTVTGCCSKRLPGATVTLSDGQTATTDASGQCSFWVGLAATIGYTIGKTRFTSATGSFVVPACTTTTQSASVTLAPATGYTCPPIGPDGASHPDPIPTTLHLTDSVYGACTLTYSSGSLTWTGTIAASFPGGCGCPSASFPITYTLQQCPQGTVLLGSWNALSYAQCIFGSPTTLQSVCPADASLATTCAGKVNGSNILENAVFGQPGPYGWGSGGGLTWSVSSWTSFAASFTIPSCTCGSNAAGDLSCGGVTGSYKGIPWPSGGTVTLTE